MALKDQESIIAAVDPYIDVVFGTTVWNWIVVLDQTDEACILFPNCNNISQVLGLSTRNVKVRRKIASLEYVFSQKFSKIVYDALQQQMFICRI